jgi:hypothetical protein
VAERIPTHPDLLAWSRVGSTARPVEEVASCEWARGRGATETRGWVRRRDGARSIETATGIQDEAVTPGFAALWAAGAGSCGGG